jgi:hypothetical protein
MDPSPRPLILCDTYAIYPRPVKQRARTALSCNPFVFRETLALTLQRKKEASLTDPKKITELLHTIFRNIIFTPVKTIISFYATQMLITAPTKAHRFAFFILCFLGYLTKLFRCPSNATLNNTTTAVLLQLPQQMDRHLSF